MTPLGPRLSNATVPPTLRATDGVQEAAKRDSGACTLSLPWKIRVAQLLDGSGVGRRLLGAILGSASQQATIVDPVAALGKTDRYNQGLLDTSKRLDQEGPTEKAQSGRCAERVLFFTARRSPACYVNVFKYCMSDGQLVARGRKLSQHADQMGDCLD